MQESISTPLTLLAYSDKPNVLETINSVIAQLSFSVQHQAIVATPQQVLTKINELPSPDLLLLDISELAQPQSYLRQLALVCDPSIKVVLFGHEHHVDFYRQLLAMGISEYFSLPLQPMLVAQTLTRLMSATSAEPFKQGQWITVLGCGGGVGVTTVTAQLSRGLAANDRHTLVVDSDYLHGNIDIHFDVTAHYSMLDLVREHQGVDELIMTQAAAEINAQLSLLKGRDNDGELTPSQAINLRRELIAHRDLVVCDMALNSLSSAGNQALVAHSDVLVVLLSPTISGLREAQCLLNGLESHSKQQRVILVLNYNAPSVNFTLTPAQITAQLAREINVIIPYGAKVMSKSEALAHNVLGEKTSVTKALLHLVEHVIAQPIEVSTARRPRWLTRLKNTVSREA